MTESGAEAVETLVEAHRVRDMEPLGLCLSLLALRDARPDFHISLDWLEAVVDRYTNERERYHQRLALRR